MIKKMTEKNRSRQKWTETVGKGQKLTKMDGNK